MENKKYSTTTNIPTWDTQEIKGAGHLEDLEFEPEQITRIFTTNLFQRTLAHVYGKVGNKWKGIAVDENGVIITKSTLTAIKYYDVITVTAGDDESVPYEFEFIGDIVVTRMIDIFIRDADALIRLIPEDETELEQIWLPADSYYSIDVAVKGFTVQNAVAGSNATVQVIGWY